MYFRGKCQSEVSNRSPLYNADWWIKWQADGVAFLSLPPHFSTSFYHVTRRPLRLSERFFYSDLTSGDMRRRLPVCIFRESPSLIQHDDRRFPSSRRARDLWAQTSSCEMSHPSVLNITVNINDSLFAICGPSGSSLKGPGRLLCIQFNMRWQKLPSELSRGRA